MVTYVVQVLSSAALAASQPPPLHRDRDLDRDEAPVASER
jgi:hypothetical protein